MGSQPSWVLSPRARAPIQIGLSGHWRARRRPAPTPLPRAAKACADWKSASPGRFAPGVGLRRRHPRSARARAPIGNRPPWALMCRASASADAIRLVGEGRPLAAGPGRVTSSHRRNRPLPTPPGRRGPIAPIGNRPYWALPCRASACADAAPVRRRPVAPIGNRPPWALMCRASASADAIRLVGEGRPLAAGPGRVTSSHRRNRPPPTPPGRRRPIAPIGNRPPLGASRRASACADAAPSGSEGLRRLEIGLPWALRAGRRPAPTPLPRAAKACADWKSASPGRFAPGVGLRRRHPRSAQADHWPQAQKG
jgi:hypothetical protein